MKYKFVIVLAVIAAALVVRAQDRLSRVGLHVGGTPMPIVDAAPLQPGYDRWIGGTNYNAAVLNRLIAWEVRYGKIIEQVKEGFLCEQRNGDIFLAKNLPKKLAIGETFMEWMRRMDNTPINGQPAKTYDYGILVLKGQKPPGQKPAAPPQYVIKTNQPLRLPVRK